MKQRGVMNTNTMENFFAGIMAGIMAFGILMLSIFPTAFLFKITWKCIASNYLVEYIPANLIDIPYWHVVSFMLVCTYLGSQINKLTPKIMVSS